MSEEIKQLVGDFLIEVSKSDTPHTDRLIYPFGNVAINIVEHAKLMERQRDRAIDIANRIMDWDTPADARKSCKDLSDLKKEINA